MHLCGRRLSRFGSMVAVLRPSASAPSSSPGAAAASAPSESASSHAVSLARQATEAARDRGTLPLSTHAQPPPSVSGVGARALAAAASAGTSTLTGTRTSPVGAAHDRGPSLQAGSWRPPVYAMVSPDPGPLDATELAEVDLSPSELLRSLSSMSREGSFRLEGYSRCESPRGRATSTCGC